MLLLVVWLSLLVRIAPAMLSCGTPLNGGHRTDLLYGFGAAGRLPEAAFLKRFNVDLTIHHSTAQLQELRANAFRSPALKAGLTNAPPICQLPLVHVQYFHFVQHEVGLSRRPWIADSDAPPQTT